MSGQQALSKHFTPWPADPAEITDPEILKLLALDREAYSIMEQARYEYASESNRLENFTLRQGILQASPTARTMTVRDSIIHDMGKHLLSIIKGVSLRESMRGRYIDLMNYIRLLYLYDEAHNGSTTQQPQQET